MTTALEVNRVFGLLLIIVGVSDVLVASGLIPVVTARWSSNARVLLFIVGLGLLIVGGLHVLGMVHTI